MSTKDQRLIRIKEAILRVYQELRAVIAGETKKYKLDGSDALAAAAIVELMSVQAPDHPLSHLSNPTDPDSTPTGESSIFSLMFWKQLERRRCVYCER